MLERSDYIDQAAVPFGKREVKLTSPNISDLTVIEVVPISPENYEPLPYGSPHPDYTNNGLVLVWQGPVKAANNQVKVLRVYANRDTNQDWFNYALHYGGDLAAVPIFIRSYIMLRTDFDEKPRGQPFRGIYGTLLTNQGVGYHAKPTITVTGGAGSGAQLEPIMNETGDKVIGIHIIEEGDGFTSTPSIGFSGGSPTTPAAATPVIQPADALLIKEETGKLESEDPQLASLFIKVNRVYETLPGAALIWDTYQDERGAVQKSSQPILAVGNEVASFTRPATGLARKTWYEPRGDSAVVLNKIIEEWTEVIVNDQEVTSEFGGGILDVTERRALPGAQAPDSGLRVTSSKTETVSPAEQIKKSKILVDSEWPEMLGSDTDPKYGIVVNFAKKVVPAGTVYPGVALSIVTPYVDIAVHDKWRSIQINSKVREPLPGPITWGAYHHLDLPSTLLGVTASWDRVGGESALARMSRGFSKDGGPGIAGVVQVTAAGGTLSSLTSADAGILAEAQVSVNNGVNGAIEILFNHGYRGPAKATIERRFYLGPPPFLDLPAVTKIIPVTGTASLIGKHTSFNKTQGTGPIVALGTNGQLSTKALTFGPFLSGSLVANVQTFDAATSSADAQAGPDLDGVSYESTFILPGAQGKLNVNIPVSDPVSIASGTQIVVDVIVEEWRFNVFVVYIITATVP